MKRMTILLVVSMLTTSLFAQYGDQFTNRGFEDWTTRASEPVHWHSGGTATGTWAWAMPNTMEQSGHPRPGSTGSMSIRLVPSSVMGVTANGSCTNGRINAGSTSAGGSSNYNYTQRSNEPYNTPITMLPDSLTIWICFRSVSSTDRGYVEAVVHGNADYQIIANGTESPANMHVATAKEFFTRTSTNGGAYNWRRLSVPFNNSGPCTDIRYILFVATSNESPGDGSTSDDLFLDDVLLIYNPTLSMGNLSSTSLTPGNSITIPFTLTGTMSPDNLNASANVVIAQMSDASGSFSNPTELGRVTTNSSGSISAQIPNVANGQYSIRVISTNYPMIGQNIQQVTITNPTYTIAATANPSAGGTVTGGGEYNAGQSCTLTATANTGYTFTNWTENGAEVSTNPSYTFNVTGNRTLVANFTINSYNVSATANPSAGGTVSGAGSYNHGSSCTLAATASTGYTFTNWTENGGEVSTNANYTFNVTGNRTLVANFTLNFYNVSATANPSAGGTVSGAGSYNHGASCTLTATASMGYTFTNWTENGAEVSTNAIYTFNVTGNRALVANFTLNSYNVSATANPSAGGTVSGAGSYNHGSSCTLTATANVGYTFTNWTENGSEVSTNPNYTFNVTGDRILVAHFTLNSYSITVSANPSDGGTVSGGGSFNYGENCTLSATAATGYTFTNWTENGNVVSSNATYTFTVEGNRALVANFTINSYTITVSANPSNSGTTVGGGTYNYGQSCTVIATSVDGYTFTNWTENGSVVSTDANYTFTVNSDRTLVANFEEQAPDTYNINVSPNPNVGGTVTGGGNYVEGEQCTVTATANTGYTFLKWTENGNQVSTNASYSFTVTGNRTLVAQFQVQSYTISTSVNPSNSGVVSGGGNYNYGQSCTLTATANTGYTFANWTENGNVVSISNSFTFTVEGSRSIVANFTINTHSITATANPREGGVVTGEGTYSYGASCTLTAIANAEYAFVKWTKNGIQVSTDASYTFTVTASAEYVAHFQGPDGVEENTVTSQVFPNPFTSKVNIKAEKTVKSVSVFDIYGRLVKEQFVSDTDIELDLSDLSNGAYLLRLDYGDNSSIHRIVKITK